MEKVFFWGHTGHGSKVTKTCLSNFYPCEFEFNDKMFNFSEQCFMYQKALLFNDFEIAEQILNETDVRKIKALGRKVKDFDNELWDKHKEDFMFNACYAKFSQDNKLKDFLLNTGNSEIVEASPVDNIWGIGFSSDKAMENVDKWGQNLLGKVLMEVREELRK
mgnify:FL=1|jgi:ribA/ribD-fused uncharacterized protein